MRKEKRYCKKRFDQSEIKMKIKRTPLNLETWPKIHLWHRQMPGDAPKPLQNESSKKKKKAAKFCNNNCKKFYQHQTSRNLFLQNQKLQKNRQVESIDLLPEIRHLTNVSSSIDKNAILPSFMVS